MVGGQRIPATTAGNPKVSHQNLSTASLLPVRTTHPARSPHPAAKPLRPIAVSTPLQGVLPRSGQQISVESRRGQPLSGAREPWMATFGRAPGRELGLFSCSIPPGFVINHNMPTINTTSDWLCSGAFRYTDRRIGKERTGPDRDERFHYFSMAPNWAIGSEKIILLCIAGGHNLNAALAQPERIAPPTNPTILVVT